MRMWMINPEFLCNQHLLGEHVECHMFVGTLNKGVSVSGYLENKLLEIHNLAKRHSELVKEMKRRGFIHQSELPKYKLKKLGKVDVLQNLSELYKRCSKCKERMGGQYANL